MNPWWKERSIQTWAWQAWRYYSWRPTYRLTLTTSEQTAYVNMRDKLVVCNPEYPYPPLQTRRHVRHCPDDVRAYQLKYLESLIAHEAGHTHHTGELPAGRLLAQLVNIIEDHRMERLMALDFPHLRGLFEFACDADAAHAVARGGLGGDCVTGCLLHRFTHTHPAWSFTPDHSDARHWPAVKAILERAWDAPEYADVIVAAREILALLGLDETEPERPDLQLYLDGEAQDTCGNGVRAAKRGKSSASGSGQPGQAPPQGDENREDAGDPAGEDPASAPDERADDDHSLSSGGDEESDADSETGPPGKGIGSGTPGPPPPRPDFDPTPSAATLALRAATAADARKLAAILRVHEDPWRTVSHRERGRFRADRYLTGSDRPFDLKTGGERESPTHLRVALDISASMGGQAINCARHLAFTCVTAAQQTGTPIVAVAFDHQVHPLIEAQTRHTQAQNAISALRHIGDTALSPALRWLWAHDLPGHSLTIVITDGQLSALDYRSCHDLRAAHQGAVIPVLLGTREDIRAAYEQAFGVCVRLDDPAQLVTHLTSFLRAHRARQRRT